MRSIGSGHRVGILKLSIPELRHLVAVRGVVGQTLSGRLADVARVGCIGENARLISEDSLCRAAVT